jgi:hypothetical protein
MDIEMFVLCDAATEFAGKLNLLGTFDTLATAAMPAMHPHCALAIRLRFHRVEEGQHAVRINVTDADGRLVIPKLDGNITVRFRTDDQTAVTNLVLNLEQLKFEKPGQYSIDLAIDGRQERSLPLFVRLREKPPAASTN